MGLKIDKDNIYLITNNSKYDISDKIDNFMENDFTIFIRSKIKKKSLKFGDESFLFARNGMHSGISAYLDELNQIRIRFTYWVNDFTGSTVKIVEYLLLENEEQYNDYIVTCDHNNKIMTFYVSGNKAGEINYNEFTKVNYNGAFIWLGCGSMIIEDIFKCVGDFEYELLFGLDKCLLYDDVIDIVQNRSKYVDEISEYELPLLKPNILLRNNFKFFFDFEHRNTYKVWNIVGDDNFLQLYIENNISF